MKKNSAKIQFAFASIFLLCFVWSGSFAQENLTYVMDDSSKKSAEKIPEYTVEKKVVVERDKIRLELDGTMGSFSLYALPEKGRSIALLSSYDSGSASFFVLRAGRREYRLTRANGIKAEARRTPLGAQMAYLVPDVAQVVVDFSFMPSVPNSTKIDMLRVTVYTINLAKTMQSFALKAVFDTVLGENTYSHFSTAAHSKINSEMQFSSMTDDLWVRSNNEKAAIQFLVEGAGISKVSALTLATKDAVTNSVGWIPVAQFEKSFTSVVSYNNSAVGINWSQVYLDSLKTDAVGFFISVATDGELPAGRQFLSDLESGDSALGVYSKAIVPTTKIAPPPKHLTREEAGVRESLVNEITEEQLDTEYIQSLLDHIAALSAESSVDDEELGRLNSELDAILEKLGELR